jgi:hypothetical protein
MSAVIACAAREFVAAVRPANTFQNAVAHQRLQNRLEMAGRKPMARGQRLGRYRRPERGCNIDNCGNGKDALRDTSAWLAPVHMREFRVQYSRVPQFTNRKS